MIILVLVDSVDTFACSFLIMLFVVNLQLMRDKHISEKLSEVYSLISLRIERQTPFIPCVPVVIVP